MEINYLDDRALIALCRQALQFMDPEQITHRDAITELLGRFERGAIGAESAIGPPGDEARFQFEAKPVQAFWVRCAGSEIEQVFSVVELWRDVILCLADQQGNRLFCVNPQAGESNIEKVLGVMLRGGMEWRPINVITADPGALDALTPGVNRSHGEST